MSETPNTDPGIKTPELQFSEQQIQYLEGYTTSLRRAYYSTGDDIESFQESVERTVRGGVEGVLTWDIEQNDGLTLAVVSEGLGATRTQHGLAGLWDVLDHGPLLDREDKTALSRLIENSQAMRNQGIPEDEIMSALSSQVGNDLSYINQLEEKGRDKGALKIALLGFYTGATLRAPNYQAPEQLIAEVLKNRK